MKKKISKKGYELADISIVQAKESSVNSRFDANPYIEICNRGNTIPLFVAPMATVIDSGNWHKFMQHDVIPVVPRSAFNKNSQESEKEKFDTRVSVSLSTFVSFSLFEAECIADRTTPEYISVLSRTNAYYNNKVHICIDIAHGTLKRLFNVCRKLKSIFGESIVIMTGNIANPEAYKEYCKCGIDWVRCSIGSGSRCTTSCNTAVHYPMATLLDEINAIRKKIERRYRFTNLFRRKKKTATKVIADGGINDFEDIAKCLALGADAVMCGKMFNECEEAAYPVYYAENENEFMHGDRFVASDNKKMKRYREYFGMSSDIAKPLIGSKSNFSQEGTSYPTEVKYTLSEFTKKVKDYLRSCMSYTNCKTIEELRNNCEIIVRENCGTYRK